MKIMMRPLSLPAGAQPARPAASVMAHGAVPRAALQVVAGQGARRKRNWRHNQPGSPYSQARMRQAREQLQRQEALGVLLPHERWAQEKALREKQGADAQEKGGWLLPHERWAQEKALLLKKGADAAAAVFAAAAAAALAQGKADDD
ncbi:hypothetical protein FOA52_014888 [Chlamydomonas sp. UWO 241]|nr:hypothetical protein FOA52_014888 [Chlamydomonas sp. UWO 241]